MAWNIHETNVPASPSLYRQNRQNGDAMARHGCLATLRLTN